MSIPTRGRPDRRRGLPRGPGGRQSAGPSARYKVSWYREPVNHPFHVADTARKIDVDDRGSLEKAQVIQALQDSGDADYDSVSLLQS